MADVSTGVLTRTGSDFDTAGLAWYIVGAQYSSGPRYRWHRPPGYRVLFPA